MTCTVFVRESAGAGARGEGLFSAEHFSVERRARSRLSLAEELVAARRGRRRGGRGEGRLTSTRASGRRRCACSSTDPDYSFIARAGVPTLPCYIGRAVIENHQRARSSTND